MKSHGRRAHYAPLGGARAPPRRLSGCCTGKCTTPFDNSLTLHIVPDCAFSGNSNCKGLRLSDAVRKRSGSNFSKR